MECMDLNYLKRLGYTEQEIEEYTRSWNENNISYLSENENSVSENMNYMMAYFDKDLVLKLSVFYSSTFVLSPLLFKKRIQLLRNAFPDDWIEIIKKQFWGYDGIPGTNYEPIMRVMGAYDDSDVERAIKQLKNPQNIIFEFIVLLKDVGIELSAADFYEEFLMDLEESKYEVVRNAKTLVKIGISIEVVESIITNAPFLVMLSEMEVIERLRNRFGENYKDIINEMEEDAFLEALEEIAW